MKTPITDRYVADNYNVRVFDANHCFDFARRLELDRAIFRQALIDIYISPAPDSREIANKALQAASKFERETHEP